MDMFCRGRNVMGLEVGCETRVLQTPEDLGATTTFH